MVFPVSRFLRPVLFTPIALALLYLLLPPLTLRAGSKRELPERFQKAPYTLMSLSVGYPNDGWQVRAKRLRSTPYLKVRAKSRKLNYGHPALVLMLKRTAHDIASAEPGSVMLVGDLSRKHGGPLAGHVSHQSGRDADIGFYVMDKNGKAKVSKQFHPFGADGVAKDGSGLRFDDWRNWLLVKSWILDKRAGISHIFIERPLRTRLLRFAAKHPLAKKYVTDAASLLKEPSGTSVHDDHFHVRISCPKRHEGLCHNESK